MKATRLLLAALALSVASACNSANITGPTAGEAGVNHSMETQSGYQGSGNRSGDIQGQSGYQGSGNRSEGPDVTGQSGYQGSGNRGYQGSGN